MENLLSKENEMSLSERVRPNVECAPWVAEETAALGDEITKLRKEITKAKSIIEELRNEVLHLSVLRFL